MTLVCFNCKNKAKFLQIAHDQTEKSMEREIKVTRDLYNLGSFEYKKGSWASLDKVKSEGIYCANCHKPVDIEAEDSEFLSDRPVTMLNPKDFKVDTIATKIEKNFPNVQKYVHDIPQRQPSFAKLSAQLNQPVLDSLKRQGYDISKFYSHQVKAIENILKTKNVIISTSAASGKTLCFNIPVMNTFAENNNATALYMYPTKALAQDQILKILQFSDDYTKDGLGSQKGSFFRLKIDGEKISLGKYDGSTSDSSKAYMRRKEHPNILLTNPDMLHFGILRNNQRWKDFLSNLIYVVLDEIHVYRGVFGSNVALVVRRLRKLCDINGADPIFILCSATIGNPLEHAKKLTGCNDFVLVDNDGAPRKKQKLILWNPPLIEKDLTDRIEVTTSAIDILTKAMLKEREPIRSIMFGRSRLAVKNIYNISKRRLREHDETKNLANFVREYTATLTPEKREVIGKELAAGQIAAIIATNALELGIDIGDLSCATCVGYPGSIASLYQEIGRAGRKGEGMGILILQNNPLEQYFFRNAEEFIAKEPELVRINPTNDVLLSAHLAYCAYECDDYGGLLDTDFKSYFGIDPKKGEELLTDPDLQYKRIRDKEACWCWEGGKPEYNSIRNPISKNNFKIICDNKIVGVMDAGTVLRDLHPNAVWSDQDDYFVVQNLDFDSCIANVIRRDVDYYTMGIPLDRINVDKILQENDFNKFTLKFGETSLKRSVFLYRKVKYVKKKGEKDKIHKVEGQYLPSIEFTTQCAIISFSPDFLELMTSENALEGGVHAIEHAIASILPRFVDCDLSDIGSLSDISPRPTIYIYDNFSGGIGIAETCFDKFEEVINECKHLIETCKCKETNGCPACIQTTRCSKNNDPLNKEVAIKLLRGLIK